MAAEQMTSYPPLTPEESQEFYPLDRPENAQSLAFFQKATGITDPVALKAHLIEAQTTAYAVRPYPCIRGFSFLSGKLSRHPAYPHVKEILKADAGGRPLLIDLGCFLGVEIRTAVLDGWPRDAALGVDLTGEYFPVSAKLFNDQPGEPPKGRLIQGDVFDDTFLDPKDAPRSDEPIDIFSLASLKPLHHRARVIVANAFFHLFDEAHQADLARRCASLLDPQPGSVILGSHVGLHQTGFRTGGSGRQMFAHNPESWEKVWQDVYGADKVRVKASIHTIDRPDLTPDLGWRTVDLLVWSVTLV